MIYFAAAALVILLLAAGNNIFSVTRFQVFSDKTEKHCRIMFISDVHAKHIKGRIVKIIHKYGPDMILIGGDLWDREKGRVDYCMELVLDMARRAPVIYSPGNHDYDFPERERMLKQLAEEAGAQVLRAHKTEICGIEIIGFDRLGYRIFGDKLFKRENGKYRVLLTHFPHYFEEYANRDLDMVLSGHAHGGQFRIPFAKKGIYSPGQGLFPKYSEGMHEQNGTKMIVSRGIGNSSSFPFRLFNPPEAVIIDIFPEDGQ